MQSIGGYSMDKKIWNTSIFWQCLFCDFWFFYLFSTFHFLNATFLWRDIFPCYISSSLHFVNEHYRFNMYTLLYCIYYIYYNSVQTVFHVNSYYIYSAINFQRDISSKWHLVISIFLFNLIFIQTIPNFFTLSSFLLNYSVPLKCFLSAHYRRFIHWVKMYWS